MINFKLNVLIILLTIGIVGQGCSKAGQSLGKDPIKIGGIFSVFELKYGESKVFTYNGKNITLTLKNVKDSVDFDYSLANFINTDELQKFRVNAYLQIDNKSEYLTIKSKPCGALPYVNDDKEVEDILNRINQIQLAPANSNDEKYFSDQYMALFGNGSNIDNSSLRIFITKADPIKYKKSNALEIDYKFNLILST
jgi:hypothetical protein